MESLASIFPCQNPRNPGMVEPHQRRNTFNNWNKNIKATVDELVEAGFLYLNEGDKLKCFYCNGGLQHWQYNEDPWFEHAKWYPNCEYLLRKKGLNYVQSVADLFPTLRRPVFQYPVPPQQSSPPRTSCAFASQTSRSSLASTSRGVIVADAMAGTSSHDQPSVPEKLTLQKAMESTIVNEALGLAFDKDLVSKVVQRKLENENREYDTMLKLVEDILNAENDPSFMISDKDQMEVNFYAEKNSNNNVLAPGPSRNIPSNSTESNSSELGIVENVDNESIQTKIDDIKNEQTCKVCLDRISDCVFLPCGHVCCCITCGSALRKCPICRESLEKIVKFYR